jgi:prevent-host-death family protein
MSVSVRAVTRMASPYAPAARARHPSCVHACYGPFVSDPSTDGRLRVGIRELRNQVAAVVRRAEAGERVVITVDGRPVAQLGPLEPDGPPTLDDLVASGLARPPRRLDRPPAPDPIDPPIDARSGTVLDELRGG